MEVEEEFEIKEKTQFIKTPIKNDIIFKIGLKQD